MALETARSSSASRKNRVSPPKAARAISVPAASFTGAEARKPHPGRNNIWIYKHKNLEDTFHFNVNK